MQVQSYSVMRCVEHIMSKFEIHCATVMCMLHFRLGATLLNVRLLCLFRFGWMCGLQDLQYLPEVV